MPCLYQWHYFKSAIDKIAFDAKFSYKSYSDCIIMRSLFCGCGIMTRRLLVAGNWKLNGSLSMTRDLISEIKAGLPVNKNYDVAVFPPVIFIPQVANVAGDAVFFGAQTLSEHDKGAYTGEISGAMLREFGCQMVLVGHSERRAYYNESNQDVAKKFQTALKHGLKPILCCGETLEQRESGVTEEIIAQQLNAVIDLVGIDAFKNAVIAYEPVWAIGTGMTASPEQAQEMHAFIRSLIENKYNNKVANNVSILYGGSVKPANAKEIFSKPDVDGGLIGGAALKADMFAAIIKAMN